MPLITEETLWIFGMSLNILGSVMVNFGTNLMKSAHNITKDNHRIISSRNEKDISSTDIIDNGSSTRIWRIGMGVFVVGSMVNFTSFAFAAQSLLAALGTVQFVSNVIFAKCVLKEQLTYRILIATCIIVFGLIVAIRFSNHATEQYTAQDLIALYSNSYLIFLLVVFICLIILHLTYLKYTYAEEYSKKLPFSDIVRPATYAIVSATVGTQSVLQSKCIAELIKASFKGSNQFDQWFFYAILLIFILGLTFWLHRMNAALKKFDGLIIIPLLQVFWTTSAILQGGVYFKEFEKFSDVQTVGFCLGVVTVFIGVFLLTPSKKRDSEAMGQSLITADGTPATGDDMDDSSSCTGGPATGPPSSTAINGHHHLKQHHSFSNCGLSVDGEAEGGLALERLVSLTYMPVVVNDANIAFYMDKAMITSGSSSGGGISPSKHGVTHSESSLPSPPQPAAASRQRTVSTASSSSTGSSSHQPPHSVDVSNSSSKNASSHASSNRPLLKSTGGDIEDGTKKSSRPVSAQKTHRSDSNKTLGSVNSTAELSISSDSAGVLLTNTKVTKSTKKTSTPTIPPLTTSRK